MSAPATYDPSKILVTVGGAIISGYADGTFVNVEYENDFYTKVVGADKQTTRIKQNDYSGMITLNLTQSSLSNDILTGFVILDRTANAGIVPVLIKDLLSASLAASAYAWVRKPPALEYSKELSNREWILDCVELELFTGGNFPFSL